MTLCEPRALAPKKIRRRETGMMGERSKPRIEVIHPHVEVLPPDHVEPQSSVSGSRVWLSVDLRGGTRRVHIAKPGPIATILLVLAFAGLVTVSFVVALGLFAIFVGVSAIGLAGLAVYAMIQGALKRLR
jgi:hypothetical protein